MAEWRREQFDLQHWWAWLGNIETDLYEGEARTAWKRVAAEWPRLRWSLMTRVQYIYLESLHHRARAALALAAETAAGERREMLARAERDVRRMEREGAPWSSALATLVRAGITAVRGVQEESMRLLDLAEQRLEACDMSLYAYVARRERGRLLGGAAGRDLSAEAEEWMQNQEILNPERITAMLAPGF